MTASNVEKCQSRLDIPSRHCSITNRRGGADSHSDRLNSDYLLS